MRVSEWLDYWLENVVLGDHPYTTYAAYEQCVRLHLKPRLGGKKLNGLNITDVRAFKAAMIKDKGASIAKRALAPLRSALTAAMKEDLLMRNVAQLVDLPEVEVGDYEPWSHEEATTFFRAAQSHWLYAGFLLRSSCLRRGEVRGLRWSDVDLQNRTLRVRLQSQRIKVPGRQGVRSSTLITSPRVRGARKIKD
jgi:integrase